MDPLLEVRDLCTVVGTSGAERRVVDGVGLSVGRGEIVGVVGESGCGKTMLALSILRLLPWAARVVDGSIRIEGREVLQMKPAELRAMRGADVAMTFQDPMSSLNPLTRIGRQVREAMVAHYRSRPTEASQRVVPLLKRVRLPEGQRLAGAYPHQLSGGMRQRVMMAMGIANDPALVIADEPTTALDTVTQAQIVGLLAELNRESGTAILIITHNVALLARLCQRVVVMYAGRVVEDGPVEAIFSRPQHPYTWGLLQAIPRIDAPARSRLVTIPGQPPAGGAVPSGCTFHPRCRFRQQHCLQQEPPLLDAGATMARCWVLMESIAAPARYEAEMAADMPGVAIAPKDGVQDHILRLEELSRHFDGGSRGDPVRAVDRVSLAVRRGETLAIIGESGCGKTTLARIVARLLPPTSGRALFENEDLTSMTGRRLRQMRRRIQIILQNPFGSLNPRMTIAAIVSEPLRNLTGLQPDERRRRLRELLDMVGLGTDAEGRHPHEFSGGQRQRIAIARALAVGPQLLICDEPVSALDVSIQAQVINLLRDLQRHLGLTMLFIAHDLAIVRHLADRVAVMRRGALVELASTEDILTRPQHAYTRLLLDSTPVPDPARARSHTALAPGPDRP